MRVCTWDLETTTKTDEEMDKMTNALRESFVEAMNKMGFEEFRKISWFGSNREGTNDE